MESSGKTAKDIKEASVKHIKKLIKTAEDIAEMKKMEIEREFDKRKFIEEIEQQIVEMHIVMQKFKEVDIEKMNEEYDMKHIEAKKTILENQEAKETGTLLEEEMDAKQMKRKMKKTAAKKRRVARKEVEKEITKKIKKMIESEYREMMVVEVRDKIKEAEDLIIKVKEPKNMETIKEADIIKEIKNMIEAEFLEKMAVETQITFEESEEGKNMSTMAARSTSRTKLSKIDTVSREAWKLFDVSIKRCDFSNIESEALIKTCTKKGWGDFECHNILTIWPELRKIGTKLQGPKDVGKEIIRNLPQSDMIEGTPSLHSVGFVTFKISGRWMAKKICRMLIEGIETWAPKTLLKRAIVDFPSLDVGEDTDMDMLRRRYISRSLTRMLQYSQVHVLKNPHKASHTHSAQDIVNTSKDLEALRYGAEKLKAQWLLYVTPAAKQKHVEACFSAAKRARWLEPALATYVGYRSCTTKLSKLVSMINEGEALYKVTAFVLRGNAANYSPRDVLECAIQYMFLKTPRMADCTFSIPDILDEEGDSLLYLLKTQARIRSITNTSCIDVRESENALRLILEMDDLLAKGEERELGFHILDLTEVLRSSCFAAMPHVLCRYLYELAEIFNRYFVSTFALGWRTGCFLLLCEATAVVMEKCFNLLEITPQCLKNELGVTGLIYGAELSVERPINVGSNPPITTRFEPFSIELRVDRKFESDSELGLVKVFGHVAVADTFGLRSDGWTLTYLPDDLNVELFGRPWTDPVNILNGGFLSFGDPSCSRSVPFSSILETEMDIVAMKKEEDDFYPICRCRFDLNFSKFLDNRELDGLCESRVVKGEGGQARINYILMKDAVDATLEITFHTTLENLKVRGDIVAWYESDFTSDWDPIQKSYYTASLFEVDDSSILKSGRIKLQKSRISVPRKGSLKIKAHLIQVNPRSMILDTSCVFPSLTDSISEKCLAGTDCSFQVKVHWSYCQDNI